ncbi:MAG TPA: C13 family peptidase [Candidatus Kapabacteria bacterium]|nr:C13 family peptidase [Candidatus Kapabacteria bacterium]
MKTFFGKKHVYWVGMVVMVSLFFLSGDVRGQVIKRLDMKKRDIKMDITLEKAQELMVKTVYNNQLGQRALYASPAFKKAGVNISSWRVRDLVKVKNDSWFFFVDEQPGANWEHKASYVVVDKLSGAVERIEAMSPPEEVLDLKPLNVLAQNEHNLLQMNIKQIVVGRVVAGQFKLLKKQRYAVLLSGGMNNTYNYGRYWNDLQFIYKALKEKYGYGDDEIIVLYANGTHSPNGDFDGNGTNDIDYAATKANLTTVMQQMATFIAGDGKFFFYSTNHGGDDAGANNSNLVLWGDSIKDSDFAALTVNIKCGQAVYVMEQCFSGGMMDNLLQVQTYPCSQPKVCIMTAAREDEPSWGCDTEGAYDEYIYHWTSAVFGKNPTGAAVNADTNGDGKVSMKEAHDYAVAHDSRNEHPQIGSCINSAGDVTL